MNERAMPMNRWPGSPVTPTVAGMDGTQRDHFAAITTPRGSVVSLPFLTQEEAEGVADQFDPPTEPVEPVEPIEAGRETKQCSRCNGAGGWNEEVRTKTGKGGEVVTQRWVNCRPCGGTGRV